MMQTEFKKETVTIKYRMVRIQPDIIGMKSSKYNSVSSISLYTDT